MEVELHPSTSNEIRDRVVGKVSHVRLKSHRNNRDGHLETSKKKSSFTSCFRGQGELSDHTKASLLLTVESCEVYTENIDDADLGDTTSAMEPSLHRPPTALEGHSYRYSISMSQVLRVAQDGTDVIIFFQPDTAEREHRHKTTPARFACEFQSSEEAADFLHSFETVMEQFARAMLHISRGYALPENDFQLLSVSHGPASAAQDPWNSDIAEGETVVARAPKWNSCVAAPASWAPEEGRSSTALWVYIATPLGPGLAQISHRDTRRCMKEENGRVCVSVALCQHYLPDKQRSHTVHRSCSNTELAPGARSPADSVSSVTGGEGLSLGSKDASAKKLYLHCQVMPADARQAASSSASDRNDIAEEIPAAGISLPAGAVPEETPFQQKAAEGTTGPNDASPAGDSMSSQKEHLHRALLVGGVAMLLLLTGHWLSLSLSSHSIVLGSIAMVVFSLAVLAGAWAAYSNGWLDQKLPSAAHLAEKAVAVVQSAPTTPPFQIQLLKAEVVDRERAGRAQSISILQRRASMSLSQGLADGESVSGSLDSPTGFGKDVVDRFMAGYGHDKAAARKAMQRTYDWRKETGTFHALDQPQPHFDTIKGFFDHGVVGMTRTGRCVWQMKAGMMREGWQKFKTSGLSERDIARHIAFCNDFLYKVLDTEPMPEGGRTIWINDLKGVGLRDIGSKAMDFGLQQLGLLEKHYPERMGRALVVNAPSFFNVLWRIVQPLIPAQTKKRLVVLKSMEEAHKLLLEYMEDADIPREYGGQNDKHLYESEQEQTLRRQVEKVNRKQQPTPTSPDQLLSQG